jgi:hypothetical protein
MRQAPIRSLQLHLFASGTPAYQDALARYADMPFVIYGEREWSRGYRSPMEDDVPCTPHGAHLEEAANGSPTL